MQTDEITDLTHALELIAEETGTARSPVRDEEAGKRKKLEEESPAKQKAVAIDRTTKESTRQIDARPAHSRSWVVKALLP